MTRLRNNKDGFTLIELLIVVAIIGILAAVAIPQFSKYRMRGYNAAALADLKHAKMIQEALFTDHQTYGATETGVTLGTLVGAGGPGALVQGPSLAATATVSSSAIAGLRPDPTIPAPGGVAVGLGIGISNNVNFYATSIAVVGSTGFVMVSKHQQGDRVFATESSATPVMFVQNDAFAGTALAVGGAPALGVPAVATTVSTVVAGLPGGGSPVTTWNAL